MPVFLYRALDAGGRRRRGLVEAEDARAARQSLRAQGLLAESVAPAGAGGRIGRGRGERAGLAAEARRAMVYRELGALLRAGLPLARAIEMLAAMPELAAARLGLTVALDRIREGAGPAAAFAAAVPLPAFEVAALDVGERTGTLDAMLARLADALDAQVQARARLVSALVYPAVVAVFAGVVAIALLGFLLPWSMRMWSEAGVRLPWLTRAVTGAGRWLLVLGPAAAVAAWLLARRARRRAREGGAPGRVERWLARIGPIARLRDARAAARLARTLAVLLRGGVPAPEALATAGRAAGRPALAAEIEAQAEAVRHGRSLAEAVRAVPALAAGLAPWVEAGEASGDLAPMLEAAAERQQQAWERGLTRLMSLVEPALVVALGSLVLLVALAVLLPMMSLYREVGL